MTEYEQSELKKAVDNLNQAHAILVKIHQIYLKKAAQENQLELIKGDKE